MKKLVVLVVLSILLAASCKKNDDNQVTPVVPCVTFSLNGSVWTASDFSAVYSSGAYTITATKPNEELSMVIHGSMPQTFTLDVGNSVFEFTATYKSGIGTANEIVYSAKSGSLNLSQIDVNLKYLYGTFHFTANSTQLYYKNFTSGVFTNLDYTLGKTQTTFLSGMKGGTITAMSNTTPWMSVNQMSVKSGSGYNITGVASSGDLLNIQIHDTITGNYALNDSLSLHEFDALWKPNSISTTDEIYYGIKGSLNLTTIDKINQRISGIFSFNSKRISIPEISITDGKFVMVKYSI
ncbi:MAG: DUF6252 family protein [Bacteroidota bacterium]